MPGTHFSLDWWIIAFEVRSFDCLAEESAGTDCLFSPLSHYAFVPTLPIGCAYVCKL
jgi:hypothetical protein